jgi:hypothetical protein
MEQAKAHSVSSRSIHVTNDKLFKKTEKVKLASRSNTGLFAQMLTLVRRRLHHKGIQTVKPGDKGWLDLKEVTKLATDFCNEFQIELKTGYISYIQIAMGMMNGFSPYKFKNIHANICSRFEAMQEIERDKTPDKTEYAHSYYLARISSKIGYSKGYKDIPEKYVYFVKATKEAHTIGIPIKEFIQAQFEGLEWANGIPAPEQLVTEKAKERVQRYCFEHGIRLGKAVQSSTNIFKKVKGAHKNNNK